MNKKHAIHQKSNRKTSDKTPTINNMTCLYNKALMKVVLYNLNLQMLFNLKKMILILINLDQWNRAFLMMNLKLITSLMYNLIAKIRLTLEVFLNFKNRNKQSMMN